MTLVVYGGLPYGDGAFFTFSRRAPDKFVSPPTPDSFCDQAVLRAPITNFGQLREWIKINFNIDALLPDWTRDDVYHMIHDGSGYTMGHKKDPFEDGKDYDLVLFSTHGGSHTRGIRCLSSCDHDPPPVVDTGADVSAGAGAGARAGADPSHAPSSSPRKRTRHHDPASTASSSTSPSNVPIHVLAIAAVSSTTNTAFLLPSFRRADAPYVTNSHSLLCYVLQVAPEHLPGYFGHQHPPDQVRASEHLLSKSASDRMSMFGGKWALKWEEYAGLAPRALGLDPMSSWRRYLMEGGGGAVGGSLDGATAYLESVGAFVTFNTSSTATTTSAPVTTSTHPSWVVVCPSMLGNAVSAVMNHRFVGAGDGNVDACTAASLSSDTTSPSDRAAITSEQEEMTSILSSVVASGVATMEDLLSDEALFVKKQVVTRRYLTYVLLHPSRRRCKLTTPIHQMEEVGTAVWEALQVLEFGVPLTIAGAYLFLPYMATLHSVMLGGVSAKPPVVHELGIGSSTAGPVTSEDWTCTSFMMERQLRVDRLPRGLFAAIIGGLLQVSGWKQRHFTGGLVHLSSKTPVAGTTAVEHFAVWMEVEDPPPLPRPCLGSQMQRHLVGLHTRPCVIHVRAWYEECSPEVMAGLCVGFGGGFREELPWQGLCMARRLVASAVTSAGVSVQDRVVVDVSSGAWVTMEEARAWIVEKGWGCEFGIGGGRTTPASHVIALEDLPGLTSVVAPVSKGAFFCRRCRQSRTVPCDAVCPPPSGEWEIDPCTLGDFEALGEGGNGCVLGTTWEGRRVVVKEVKASLPGASSKSGLLLLEGRVLRSLRHKHVVEVYGVCSRVPPVRVVMERVEGGSLREWLLGRRGGDGIVGLKASVVALLGVCRGMAHIHSCGVAHFDLKPDNVLMTGEGLAKVADFGLALKFDPLIKLRLAPIDTRSRGTPGFIAPELPRDKAIHRVTPMADVWSFGAMAGQVFHVFGKAAADSIRGVFDVDMFVGRCVEARPQLRPTFEELAVELQAVLEDLSV